MERRERRKRVRYRGRDCNWAGWSCAEEEEVEVGEGEVVEMEGGGE